MINCTSLYWVPLWIVLLWSIFKEYNKCDSYCLVKIMLFKSWINIHIIYKTGYGNLVIGILQCTIHIELYVSVIGHYYITAHIYPHCCSNLILWLNQSSTHAIPSWILFEKMQFIGIDPKGQMSLEPVSVQVYYVM